MPFKADKPYNELPPLPPLPPNQEVETRAVLKKCITARAALAELKQATDLIPFVACFVSRYSHAGDLLHICEGYWQPTFGKEYLQQELFSATLEGL